jgi:hypothetical protein
MKSVYSAVRTGSLNKAVCASSLKGLNWCNIIAEYLYLAEYVCFKIDGDFFDDETVCISRPSDKWHRLSTLGLLQMEVFIYRRRVVINAVFHNEYLWRVKVCTCWLSDSWRHLLDTVWTCGPKRLYYLHIYKICSITGCGKWSGELFVESRNEIKARWKCKIKASRILSLNFECEFSETGEWFLRSRLSFS